MSVRLAVSNVGAVGAGAAAMMLLATSSSFGQTCTTGPGNNGTICCQPVGPDVIVGDLSGGVQNYTAEQIPSGSGNWFDALSVGTTSCNIGNVGVGWHQFSSNLHPAIGQNLFKWSTVNGATRFEQLGQSWLKHGFLALSGSLCGCNCDGTGGDHLGVGCSDPYTASRNGTQSGAGPKWQVNATAGYFPTGSPANPSFSGTTARRLQVASTDLQTNSGSVRYFVECQYVTQDDAAFGNKNNNASYRELSVSGGPNDWTFNDLGSTVREKPGILAWAAIDPGVVITNIVTPETPIGNISGAAYPSCCSTALVILGAKATDLGNGTWHYEYAIQNLNSENSIMSFSVPVSRGVQVTNIGFHDVRYHDSDGLNNVVRDGTDWPGVAGGSDVSWSTSSYAANQNANALRWGTLYNFRFDANTGPTTGTVTLGTYKVAGTLNASSVVPSPLPVECAGDVTGNHVVDVNDLLNVINAWGACSGCPADINNDGQVNVADMLAVINAWGACP